MLLTIAGLLSLLLTTGLIYQDSKTTFCHNYLIGAHTISILGLFYLLGIHFVWLLLIGLLFIALYSNEEGLLGGIGILDLLLILEGIALSFYVSSFYLIIGAIIASSLFNCFIQKLHKKRLNYIIFKNYSPTYTGKFNRKLLFSESFLCKDVDISGYKIFNQKENTDLLGKPMLPFVGFYLLILLVGKLYL